MVQSVKIKIRVLQLTEVRSNLVGGNAELFLYPPVPRCQADQPRIITFLGGQAVVFCNTWKCTMPSRYQRHNANFTSLLSLIPNLPRALPETGDVNMADSERAPKFAPFLGMVSPMFLGGKSWH